MRLMVADANSDKKATVDSKAYEEYKNGKWAEWNKWPLVVEVVKGRMIVKPGSTKRINA